MPAASQRVPAEVETLTAPASRAPAEAVSAPKARAGGSKPAKPSERRAGADRRGPLRPEALTPVRTRFDGRLAQRAFRAADGLIIGALTALLCAPDAGGMLSASFGAVAPILAAAAVLIWSLDAVGAYRFDAHERLSGHLVRASSAFAAPMAILGAATLLPGERHEVVRWGVWLAFAFACLYLAHLGWWAQVRRWRAQGRLTPNIVVVGATRQAERLIEGLIETREAHVLGVFDDRLDRAPENIHGVPVLGDTNALLLHRITPYVDRIVLAVPQTAQGRVRQIMERLRVLPNEISLFLEFDSQAGEAAIDRLASTPLARLAGVRQDERRAFWKRIQDLVIGFVALFLAIPVMAGIALAIRLDSPGPVFFRQRRHGFNNEEITVWKFRSMRQECADATASRQITAGDERVTRVGRIIRKTSLDELPQILNVLSGEMSLVGPRPHAIGTKTGEVESSRLVAEYAHRHRLKPGMTGWAQVNGSRGPMETAECVRRRVSLDVEYIERQSFWLDLFIIFVTIPSLLGDRHAIR
jgi:Undecaprenyl-phosphate glucose phosphotransferase